MYIGVGRSGPAPLAVLTNNGDLVLNLVGPSGSQTARPIVTVHNNGSAGGCDVDMCYAPDLTGLVLTQCFQNGGPGPGSGPAVSIAIGNINQNDFTNPAPQFIQFNVVPGTRKLVSKVRGHAHRTPLNEKYSPDVCGKCGVRNIY
jgi:hypothetical protein